MAGLSQSNADSPGDPVDDPFVGNGTTPACLARIDLTMLDKLCRTLGVQGREVSADVPDEPVA